MFITMLTRTCQWSLSWTRWIQSSPSHTISPRHFLILFSHLRLGLPSGLFPSGFPNKTLHGFLIPHMRATWASHEADAIIDISPTIKFAQYLSVQTTNTKFNRNPSSSSKRRTNTLFLLRVYFRISAQRKHKKKRGRCAMKLETQWIREKCHH